MKLVFLILTFTISEFALAASAVTLKRECDFKRLRGQTLQVTDLDSNGFRVSRFTRRDPSPEMFETNRAEFGPHNPSDRPACRRAYLTAAVIHRESGRRYEVYKSNSSACDGGNTYGIIVGAGEAKAVAYLNDDWIHCVEPIATKSMFAPVTKRERSPAGVADSPSEGELRRHLSEVTVGDLLVLSSNLKFSRTRAVGIVFTRYYRHISTVEYGGNKGTCYFKGCWCDVELQYSQSETPEDITPSENWTVEKAPLGSSLIAYFGNRQKPEEKLVISCTTDVSLHLLTSNIGVSITSK